MDGPASTSVVCPPASAYPGNIRGVSRIPCFDRRAQVEHVIRRSSSSFAVHGLTFPTVQRQGLSPERALKGYTRDLSAGGLALKLPRVHLDGHYLADEDRQVKLKLELPTGPISMLVIPKRYERLEQAELGCKYLIGVQITEISDEDRKRYLSFISPEDLRRFPALKKQIAPEVARSLSAAQTEIEAEEYKAGRLQTEIVAEDVRSLPGIEKEIVTENVRSAVPDRDRGEKGSLLRAD